MISACHTIKSYYGEEEEEKSLFYNISGQQSMMIMNSGSNLLEIKALLKSKSKRENENAQEDEETNAIK